jgi:predicted phosphodiesterase
MRTLIVSDLHLGSNSGADLLRRAELRAPLLEAIADVDRVVLLGDILELRHGPMREAMAAAQPFFEDVGRALDGCELLITAGNHDHALVEPWLAGRGQESEPPPLGVEQLLEASEASAATQRIAAWASPARVRVAYPGLWVRPDVYATHGHYLDSHLSVPTLERLSVAVMSRLLGRPAEAFESVGDYESVGAPVFAWRDAVARDIHTGAALNGMATVAAWRALGGGGGASSGGPASGTGVNGALGSGSGAGASANGSLARGPGSRRRRARSLLGRLRGPALRGAFPLVVAALNRAGLGPLRADVSAEELRRAGLWAMGEVAARLGLGDAYVVFGHTHRAGPLPGDDEREWHGRGGARLINAGSWTYASIFLTATPGESPYWPGTCVLVQDTGPPVLLQLLHDRGHADIRPRRAPATPSRSTG